MDTGATSERRVRPTASAAALLSGPPREVLARLVDGDPLALDAAVRRRLDARRVLVDAEVVRAHALARCARHGGDVPARDLSAWVAARVDQAIDDLLAEERAAGDALRRALSAFNDRALDERDAFVRLVLRGVSLDTLAHEAGVSASEIGRRARRALDALLAPATRDEPERAPLVRRWSPSTTARLDGAKRRLA